MSWSEGLQDGPYHDKDGPNSHCNLPAEIVGNGSSEEPSRDDGADGVGRVDTSDELSVRVPHPVYPGVRALDCVVDGGVEAII